MPIRKKIIAGNWKMNKTATEARALVEEFLQELGSYNACDIVLCPPFTALAAASELLHASANVQLGAQNLHQKASGAYTGEISGAMLRDLFCRLVIIGHSERRQYFGESDALVKEKIKTALACELKPIVCIGETLQERESGNWRQVLETQLQGGLSGFSEVETDQIILAYEPVWAIGTGRNATPAQAQETHAFIRSYLAKLFSPSVAEKMRIQYGGSVKPDNAGELINQPDIDGALVGGASLEPRGFAAIVKA